ncbi:hypothetical protein RvY_13239 [Ramazzottius varieornatus]|uniref:Uncharacterized protein n=1 Tax=Ramazzottius varieornatus TaxID=947166 RepID=A0A1D1VSK3_RAMVA|nr:hypothetical protein RvY_13239 [Ramazzottius varieornatus]
MNFLDVAHRLPCVMKRTTPGFSGFPWPTTHGAFLSGVRGLLSIAFFINPNNPPHRVMLKLMKWELSRWTHPARLCKWRRLRAGITRTCATRDNDLLQFVCPVAKYRLMSYERLQFVLY